MRLIPKWEDSPAARAWFLSKPGILLSGIAVAFLLQLMKEPYWWAAAAFTVGTGFFPERRRAFLVAATLVWLVAYTWLDGTLYYQLLARVSPVILLQTFRPGWLLASQLVFLVLAAVAVNKQARRPGPPRALPLAWRHLLLLLAAIWLVTRLPLQGAWLGLAWLTLFHWAHSFAWLSYGLLDPPRDPGWRASLFEVSFYRQFITSSPVPKGKGWRYLEAHVPADREAREATRIRGFRLVLWAAVLFLVDRGMLLTLTKETAASADWRLHSIRFCFFAAAEGRPLAWHLNWLALWLNFAHELLVRAATGHALIGCLRMAGYGIPRNTWRPLEALTLADFWNRYFFYFKELLVDFFYFPAFGLLRGVRPWLRVAGSTFAAACLGNFLFHYLLFFPLIPERGLWETAWFLRSFFLYSLFLAAGITVSQLRILRGRELPRTALGRLRSRALVWLFFALLAALNERWITGSPRDNLAFFLALVGYSSPNR